MKENSVVDFFFLYQSIIYYHCAYFPLHASHTMVVVIVLPYTYMCVCIFVSFNLSSFRLSYYIFSMIFHSSYQWNAKTKTKHKNKWDQFVITSISVYLSVSYFFRIILEPLEYRFIKFTKSFCDPATCLIASVIAYATNNVMFDSFFFLLLFFFYGISFEMLCILTSIAHFKCIPEHLLLFFIFFIVYKNQYSVFNQVHSFERMIS